jgi:hypothetical protein
MHPDCAMSRIALWAKTDRRAAASFGPIMNDLYDFVVWGMTDGSRHIKYRWGAKDAWLNAVPSFRRKKKLDAALAATATESERLIFLSNNRGSNGTGNNAGRTVYPDAHLWVRECSEFLSGSHGEAMVAYFLEIIDLFDLAKLCYSGDMTRTKQEVVLAKAELKEWCFG